MDMHESYCANKMLANTQQYWAESNNLMDAFAIYLHRSAELSLKLAMPIMQKYQVSPSEFDVLAALRNGPAPYILTPTEVQRSMLITSGGLTKLLYQLEAREMISRSVQENDKRSKLVHLTDRGKTLIEECMKEMQVNEQTLLAGALNEKELEQLVKLLGKVTCEMEKRDGGFTSD